MTELQDVKDDYSSDSEAHVLLVSDESFVWESDENSEANVFDKSLKFQENPEISPYPKKTVLQVYKRRWLILGIFSLLSFMQVCYVNFYNKGYFKCLNHNISS